MSLLKDKRCIVSGVGPGLGYEIAMAFAREGADVAIGARTESYLEEVHDEMRQRRNEQDTARFTDADRRFHELIVDAADNAVLSSIYRMLRERQTMFTSAIIRGRVDRMDEAIAEHDKVLTALRGEDELAFCEVVRSHLAWSIALARESH